MDDKIFPSKKWERLVSPEREEKMSVKKFFDISSPKSDEVWADIGCGPGYFTLPLSKKVKKVLAVDINQKMIDICKQRSERFSLFNIEFIKSESDILPIDSNLLDNILLVNVYHEFPDRSKTNLELERILKSNGKLFVIDWYSKQMDYGPPLEHRISEDILIKELKSAGFYLVENYDIYNDNYTLEFEKQS